MEACDGTAGAHLELGVIYHLLMELDSIERTLRGQIDSIRAQSIKAKYVGSTREAESDDWPGDSFQKFVHELEQARHQVASWHASMREAANASSRSRIRSLNIWTCLASY
ncbi:hypothetical protein UA08_02892 [Talaromyces atroroseus]|uniref:Uncharacterized protein n=1 Tax=Talaromyces atroroseus TaxID=1441469 RepID=A0A225AWQ0_TALAT|nr:hypothetical protein UA08_02892 [Talaromyces atroroseus]OKL61748.1 hypothetical protein UA08_02892 [Talaromyces atroroseus]